MHVGTLMRSSSSPSLLCAHAQVVAGLNYKLVLSVKDKAKKHFNLEAVVFQVGRVPREV